MDAETLVIGSVSTPQLDPVWLAMSNRGLVAVEFRVPRRRFEATVRKQMRRATQLVFDPSNKHISGALCEIAEYVAGQRRVFRMPIDWSILGSDFQREALRAVMAIPYGMTSTYGKLAIQIGYPEASRAVGRANATNPMPLVIPCHRVIGSDGKLRGYGGAGGLKTKQWLLDMERSNQQ